ncbi:hypothetical protein HY485_04065 [Candidatus Woesearchaeota archaeon]|nr:hypothetical protein [Candidatus Woesearchaeota archaeon]
MSDDKLKVLNIEQLVQDITKAARLKINQNDDPFREAKEALQDIEQAFGAVEHELKTYQNFAAPQKTNTKPAYNKKPEIIPLFKTDVDKHSDVILTINTQTTGWLKKKITRDAQLLLRGREDIAKFEYIIPENDDKLTQEKTNELMRTIESFALTHHYSASEETALVSAVANTTGMHSLPQDYFERKYARICNETNEKLQQLGQNGRKSLNKFYERIAKALETAAKQITEEEFVQAITKEQKARAERIIAEEVSKVRARLITYEEKKRSEIERHYDAELEEIKRIRAESEEKLTEIKQRYSQKREKLVKDSHKISSGLEEIFPDNNRDPRNGYDNAVDHTLRVYYAKRLENDLSESKHVEVNHALRMLEILRNACFPLNERPRGANLRSAYAGIAAVIDYVEKHEADINDTITNLETAARNKPRSPKPTVEQFLESVISYDFDMKKYEAGLHKKNATKESLGVK